MNNPPYSSHSGVEKRNGRGMHVPSEQDAKFLRELDELLWQRFRQTLPEMLGDLYRQSTISTPELSADRIVKELIKIGPVREAVMPLLKKYKKDV